ncbi:hypothetical protein E8E12_006595 [Didymella heteroderae]|uniref:Uncharacterized protein n=1 Tax=Didymella heteroderae TaxID=1769908 RepID=A0A9P4WRN3_9PLEO|nr:hypothetical protein E8E12_006595 [Didymella heteroderae]
MCFPTTFPLVALLSGASAIVIPQRPSEPLSICESVFPGSQDTCCNAIFSPSGPYVPCYEPRAVSNLTDCGVSHDTELDACSCCIDKNGDDWVCAPDAFLDEYAAESVEETIFAGTFRWTSMAAFALADYRRGDGPWASH